MMEIISRKEAKKLNLKYYFTGKKCKHGHISKRDMKGSCYECKLKYERDSKRHLSRVDYQKKYMTSYNQKNKREVQKRYYEKNKDRELERSKLKRINNQSYYSSKCAERRAAKKSATPSWFDKLKVNKVYDMARLYGFEVDHIVPIVSDLVCGLHCWENLQLLDRGENAKKSNSNWPYMEFQE